ncbi:MAG TPA: molybdopterin molybdenumtransferase MoeA [Actinobacteria bacterium]|nr:molybdopterin molybdenumtransferase MoeA [Actinomycetota bacterium]
MRPLADVQAEVLDTVEPLPVRRVGYREAYGLVLAEPVYAPEDVPPFPNSAMDGYAVRAEDVAEPPVELVVVEEVGAGRVPTKTVEPGTAIAIMTGAPMPAGADAVVKVEDTEPGEGTVRILAGVEPGRNVRPAGGDMAAGTLALEAGTRLWHPQLALLAAIGAQPTVRRRPVVAILSTGDELVPPETEHLGPGMIRDTNRTMLRGALEELGVTVVDRGIVPDDPASLTRVLGHAAAQADVVVTSGGVSMGEYDVVKAALRGEIGFHRVAMQPGKPFAFGTLDGVPFFGLPGNPVSVLVSFEQFVRPAILEMMGAVRLFRPRITAVAAEALDTDPAKEVFVRVAVEFSPEPTVRRSGDQSSNVLSALAAADGFAVVPVGRGRVEPGEAVDVELFRCPERRTRREALGGR